MNKFSSLLTPPRYLTAKMRTTSLELTLAFLSTLCLLSSTSTAPVDMSSVEAAVPSFLRLNYARLLRACEEQSNKTQHCSIVYFVRPINCQDESTASNTKVCQFSLTTINSEAKQVFVIVPGIATTNGGADLPLSRSKLHPSSPSRLTLLFTIFIKVD